MEFDSFLVANRDPFGAVIVGETITLHTQGHAEEVRLRVYDDETGKVTWYDLHEEDEDNWVVEISAAHAGLLYYRFEVIDGYNQYWLAAQGNNLGGAAEVYGMHHASIPDFQITVMAELEELPEWYQEARFYHIFVDRFNNGNKDMHVNNPKPNSFIYANKRDTPFYVRDKQGEIARWEFFGGNFQGIAEKLDYILELGCNAIYLSPIFEANSNHRYDTSDYLALDPILGDEDDFKFLLDEAHKRGMHIILDGVFNHVGQYSRYFNKDGHFKEPGAYQGPSSKYYHWFDFTDFPDEYNSWWGVKDLPVINKSEASYRKFIYGDKDSVINHWNNFGVDGWRLDVADELPDDFIAGIRDQMSKEQVLIGEVWEDASNKVAYDQRRQYLLGGGLQATMHYPLRNLILDFMLEEIDARVFTTVLMTLESNYPKNAFFGAFTNMGTHDTKRLFTEMGEDEEKLKRALELWLTMPGVPCVYYGDEMGMTGVKDPENRGYFPWDEPRGEIFNKFQRLLQSRPTWWQSADWFECHAIDSDTLIYAFHKDGQHEMMQFSRKTGLAIIKQQ